MIEPRQISLEQLLAKVETEQITNVLQQSRQNKSKAAELLGLGRNTLTRKLQKIEVGPD